ncbi:MAG TPA: hypothetical protein PKW24_02240 [Clostridiales bacterium]|jgi:hypothetical protein|nr:hypothetical protein [Clostridiales bacterium]
MSLQDRLKDYLFELGVTDVGFAAIHDGDFGDLTNAVSIVVKLSDAVIDEIGFDGPTHTYFSHYRAVNAFIDSVLLRAGLFLEIRVTAIFMLRPRRVSTLTVGTMPAAILIRK